MLSFFSFGPTFDLNKRNSKSLQRLSCCSSKKRNTFLKPENNSVTIQAPQIRIQEHVCNNDSSIYLWKGKTTSWTLKIMVPSWSMLGIGSNIFIYLCTNPKTNSKFSGGPNPASFWGVWWAYFHPLLLGSLQIHNILRFWPLASSNVLLMIATLLHLSHCCKGFLASKRYKVRRNVTHII